MPQSVFPTSQSSTMVPSLSSIARQSVTDSMAVTSASTFALGISGQCRPRRRSSLRVSCQRSVKCWLGTSRPFPSGCKARPCGGSNYGVFSEISAWSSVTSAQCRIYLHYNLSRLERIPWSPSMQTGLSRESRVEINSEGSMVIPKKRMVSKVFSIDLDCRFLLRSSIQL